MDVIVFVQQDPIYELVVAQFMMLNVHEASRAIQAIQGSPTSKTDMMPDNNPFYASDDIGDTLDEQPALESIECLEVGLIVNISLGITESTVFALSSLF